jgi:hypothetical protein
MEINAIRRYPAMGLLSAASEQAAYFRRAETSKRRN